MQDVELAWGAATDTGQRSENQDSALARPPVFAVADGMGGHAGGQQASWAVVDRLGRTGDGPALTVDRLRATLREADTYIRDAAAALGDRRGMGTTVAGLALVDVDGGVCWAVFHMGDSRVYRFAGGRLDRISTDHSVVQELIDLGMIRSEDASVHPQRHLVTRAIGVGPQSEADVTLLPVEAGQRFLACSDGLTGELRDPEIADLLGRIATPDEAAEELVRAAVAHGASDNVTAVVVDVRRAPSSGPASSAGPPAAAAGAAPTNPGPTTPGPPPGGEPQEEPAGA